MSEKIPSPEELRKLMYQTQSEYSIAIRELRKLERQKRLAEATTTLILTSKRGDLLKNENLKKHFEVCCEDPKFKPTVDFINSCIYLEHKDLMEEYDYQQVLSKQADKEFQMLSAQLIWYQSENKAKAIELMNQI